MQDITITGGTSNGNVAANEGGGLWNGSGVMTVSNHIIDGNTASGNDMTVAGAAGGGGIYNEGGTLDLSGTTTITNNVADGAQSTGGGILNAAGTLTANGITIMDNTSNRAGGGIESNGGGTVTLTNVNLSSNDTGVVTGAGAPGNGGGMHISGTSGTVDITQSTVSSNTAANEGGGLWNQNGVTMTVTTSTIDNNMAAEGGGIYNNTGSITIVTRSTISSNIASVSGGGLTNNGASLDLNAVTVAMNSSAGNAGGIDAVNNVSLKNTIVANNTAATGTDVSGTFTSNDYNLIGSDDLNIFTPQTNDIEGVDPALGPLQDNGGTTFTHALMNPSPAVNKGDATDMFDDQIGQAVFGSARDIGAFEGQFILSVEDVFNENSFTMYPNPSNNGILNINLDNSVANQAQVQIVSVTGQTVKRQTVVAGNNKIELNNIASGMYIVNITTDNSSASKKLIIN